MLSKHICFLLINIRVQNYLLLKVFLIRMKYTETKINILIFGRYLKSFCTGFQVLNVLIFIFNNGIECQGKRYNYCCFSQERSHCVYNSQTAWTAWNLQHFCVSHINEIGRGSDYRWSFKGRLSFHCMYFQDQICWSQNSKESSEGAKIMSRGMETWPRSMPGLIMAVCL